MRINLADYRIEINKNRKRAVFVHIPKTAGSSIQEFCRRNNIYVVKHRARYPDFVWFKDRIDLRDYFSFTVVRNPVSRCISAFNYLNRKDLKPVLLEDAERYVNKYDGNFIKFCEEEISSGDALSQIHFMPQYKWICSEKDEILVDAVFRYEELDYAIQRLIKLFDDVKFRLPHKNRSPEYQIDPKLIKKIIPIIREAYEKDFRIFEY